MKYLINDEGRECTCCGEFKEWGEYGNKKRSARGKQPTCTKCKNDLRYAKKHGCLKGDNIDPKHYDADKIMRKYISREYREKSKFYKELFKREKIIKRGRYDDLGRKCNRCGFYKYWKFFSRAGNSSMPNNRRSKCKRCISILRGYLTEEQKQNRRATSNKKREEKIKEAIRLTGSELNVDNGFIYLYRCEELDCFKIGRTIDDPREYVKVKSSSSNGNYGIKLDLVAYIVSPIRDCDAEWLATRSIKHKMVEYTKPCGGQARELFRCGLYEALLILRSISDSMYIEPNPFVSLDDLGAVEIDVHVPSNNDRRKMSNNDRRKMKRADGVVARRILRKIRNSKLWNVKNVKDINNGNEYTSTCECRIPKLSNSIKDKKGHWVVKVKSKDYSVLKCNEISKEDIYKEVSNLFDIRDSMYKNGRYQIGTEDKIKEEIINIRRKVRGYYTSDVKAYQKAYRKANKDKIKAYRDNNKDYYKAYREAKRR